MSSQEEVDLRALNLKDDEASTQGTLAVRYLVRKLQEAKTNPALAPMVQALMKEHEEEKGNEVKEENGRTLPCKRALKNDALPLL